jgi:hypothetical protein
MPVGYAEARNIVFHKSDIVAASLGHENLSSEKIATVASRAPASARPNARLEYVAL